MTQVLEPSLKLSESSSEISSEPNDVFADASRAGRKKRAAIASWAMQGYGTARNDRQRQERQWYLNLAFYYGQHHLKFRGGSSNYDMYVPSAPYYRVRPVVNYVRKIIRKDISRLTSQKPNAYVIPASSEDDDLFAAQAAEQVWESIYHTHHVDKKIQDAVFWASTCGTGFLKQYWDPDKPDQDNPDEAGAMCFTAESPFHVFIPDLLAQDIEDQPWAMHAKMVTPEYIKRMYNLESLPKLQLNDVINPQFATVMGATQTQSDKTILLETYVKPGATELLPEGGYFTMAGEEIIIGAEGPVYPHNEYPLSKIDASPSGKFYSDSIIVDLIPSQRELNRTIGQVTEAKNRMAKPQLAAEEGSVDATKITSEPGLVVFFRTGFSPPTPIPLQALPSYVLEHIDRELAFMSDLSGQHEVSKGQVPPGVTAATAISYLQEADDSILFTMFDSVERAAEKTARHTLVLAKEYWEVEHLVKITGTDGTFDSLMLKGSQLSTDIRVEGGSALPTSKAARQAFIMDMMTRGFIDPEEGLSVMEMGGLNKIYDRIQVDIKQIQRENIKLKAVSKDLLMQHITQWEEGIAKGPEEFPQGFDPNSGQPFEAPPIIPANSYDNHEMHIEYHNRYRKSQAFEMLPEWLKSVFEEHVSHHEEILMGMQTAGQLQGASPLTPGEEAPTMEAEGEPGTTEGSLQPPQPGPEPSPENVETEVM